MLLLLSQRFCSLFPALLAAQFRVIFREFTCSVFAGKLLQPTPKCVLGETLLTTIFADPETASAPRFDVQRPPLASRFVLPDVVTCVRCRCRESVMVEVRRVEEKRRNELTLPARLGRRDKRGSPVEPQAIGMAWVLACRSVGARAAPYILNSAIKEIFGTVVALAPFGVRQ